MGKSDEPLAIKIAPATRVHLADLPTAGTGGLDKDDGAQALAPLCEELNELQALMWGAGTHALLCVLQGRDASGKDGVINHVLNAVNPQGLAITSFKVPTPPEAARDFLWRVHAAVPPKGVLGVFNRSHYEQVLVVRVHNLAPPAQIEAAYEQINDFERLLTSTGTLVVKFHLHISKQEQAERLREREEELTKAWKLNPDDWAERQYWDAYTDAYDAALTRCSPANAPWYVVPADHKWAAHLAVARVLRDTLRPYRDTWRAALKAVQETQLAALAKVARD